MRVCFVSAFLSIVKEGSSSLSLASPEKTLSSCFLSAASIAAAIEQNNDERGIIWTNAMAPFQAVIVPMNYKKSEAVREAADKIYAELTAAGVDVLLDDRDERAGVLLADSELLGILYRIAIGDRGLKEGKVEYTERRSGETELVAAGEIAAKLKGLLA